MKSHFLKYKYSWRGGHRVELLVGGDAFFPAMLEALDRASDSIVLGIYQVAPGGCADRWCQRLAAAAARGVRVRVMVDAFGGFPARASLLALRDQQVEFVWFNPVRFRRPLGNLFRDHRKLLVIDGRVGFIGGFCLIDQFDPAQTDNPWHDMAIRVGGPCLRDMLAEFTRDWQFYGGQPFDVAVQAGVEPGDRCRLVRNHPRGVREVRRSTHRRLRGATRRVWFVTPYFAPSRRLRRYLRSAARRGIDVRLMLSGAETDHATVRSAGWRHYARLLRAGVRIFEYRGRCLHMKCVLIDDWVSGGSCNFDHWGLRWNRDANLEIDGGKVVADFESQLASDFVNACDEITYQVWHRRPVGERIRQWFASLIDQQLVRRAYRSQLRILKNHPGPPGPG